MTAGAMRLPVTIERLSGQRMDFGLDTSSWVTYRQPWVSLRPINGNESVSGEQVQARTTHTMLVHYDKARPILQDMRIVYGARVFEIVKAWDVNEQRQTQMLEVFEVSAG